MNYNNYEAQKLRGFKRKLELIKFHGGKCEICGYDKNISALEFHHINSVDKKFQLDMRHLSNTSLDELYAESCKCQLLCANCHREIHNPKLTIENVVNLIETKAQDKTSFSNRKEFGSICPVCGKRFPKITRKIFCSKECREKNKNYPSKTEVLKQYDILRSWEKVARHFGLTRKILQRIRRLD